MSARGWWTGVAFGVVALVTAALVYLGLLAVVPRVFTALSSDAPGFTADRQLAFGQLLAALLGLALAAGLGFVAVQQLVAGRQSVQQGQIGLAEERRARADAAEAQGRAVLRTLSLELGHNRLVALSYERRLEIDTRGQQLLAFSTRMMEALVAGPLWVLDDDELVRALGEAYEATGDLERLISPIGWLPLLLTAIGVPVFMDATRGSERRWPSEGRREGPTARGVFVGLAALTAAVVVGGELYAFTSGMPTRARESIEAAMEAIHRRLNDSAALNWADHDARLAPRYRVLPPRTPTPVEAALGRLGWWLARRFGT